MRAASLLFGFAGLLGAIAGCSTETRFTGMDPNTGTFTGGEEVVLEGTNFPRGGVSVRFCPSKDKDKNNDQPANCKEAQPVVSESASKIRVATPAGDKGTDVDVMMIFDDGRAFMLKHGFRYVDSTQSVQTRDTFFKKASGEKK